MFNERERNQRSFGYYVPAVTFTLNDVASIDLMDLTTVFWTHAPTYGPGTPPQETKAEEKPMRAMTRQLYTGLR